MADEERPTVKLVEHEPRLRWLWLLAALGIAAILWAAFCMLPGIYWNPPRLAPAFALAEGLNIYATRASAAHLGWFYGPVFPLWSLPAAYMPSLTLAFVVWGMLNLIAIVVPVWLVLRDEFGRQRAVGRALLIYGVLLLSNRLTQSLVFAVHVDGLGSGLAILSAWCLYRHVRGGRIIFLHGAALSAALAVWTKQVAISVPVGLLIWLGWTQRRALMVRLAAWLAIYGGSLAILFSWWFGAEEVIFNVWLIHTQTPRKGGWLFLGQEILRVIWLGFPWVFAGFFLWLARRRDVDARSSPTASDMAGLLVTLALCSVPLGLSAMVKEGGGANSLYGVYYVLLLLTIGVGRMLASTPRAPLVNGRIRPALAVAVIVVVALGSAVYRTIEREPLWTPYQGHEQALALARQNSGRIYFPWNPLLTIITDRKIYPFDDALYCLWLAHLSPPDEAIRAAVPAGAIIIYQEPVQSHFALNYFPQRTGQSQ